MIPFQKDLNFYYDKITILQNDRFYWKNDLTEQTI